jgi:hypothetical protein
MQLTGWRRHEKALRAGKVNKIVSLAAQVQSYAASITRHNLNHIE